MPVNTPEYMRNYWKTHPEQYKKHKALVQKWGQKNRKTKKIIRIKMSRKRYFRELKRYFMSLLGGKCNRCGYKKCPAALEFHHKNPKEKDGKQDWRNRKKFIKLVKQNSIELLCATCHRETHVLKKQIDTGTPILIFNINSLTPPPASFDDEEIDKTKIIEWLLKKHEMGTKDHLIKWYLQRCGITTKDDVIKWCLQRRKLY